MQSWQSPTHASRSSRLGRPMRSVSWSLRASEHRGGGLRVGRSYRGGVCVQGPHRAGNRRGQQHHQRALRCGRACARPQGPGTRPAARTHSHVKGAVLSSCARVEPRLTAASATGTPCPPARPELRFVPPRRSSNSSSTASACSPASRSVTRCSRRRQSAGYSSSRIRARDGGRAKVGCAREGCHGVSGRGLSRQPQRAGSRLAR